MPKAFAKKIKKADKIEIKAAVSHLNDLMIQKKAFMTLIASNVLCKYLTEQGITIIFENNNFSSLLLLKDFDIANITVENNIKIAVRAFVGDDYPQMCIPRSHFLNDILADIYVGVRLETTIDKAEFVGFIELEQINRQQGNDKYVSIEVGQLKSIDTIKQAINSSGRRKNSCLAFDHEKAKELYFKYIENRISSSDKEFFARHISSCTECSQEFNHIIELDNMIKAVGHSFDLKENSEDCTLKLFAGDPELLGEEVVINVENERGINQKTSGQKKKKRISGRKIGRTINSAGKLALLNGVILGGGQLVQAVQAANISGLIGSAVLAMSASSINGISESLSSAAENFNEQNFSAGNDAFDKNNELADSSEFNFGESENTYDLEIKDEENLISNEISDSSDLRGEILTESEPLQEFHEIDQSELISAEISEKLPDLHDDSSDLKLDLSEEIAINNDNEELINLSDEEAEVVLLHGSEQEDQTVFSEVQHKDKSKEDESSKKEEDLQGAFDDIAIEYNIDEILSSFDNVEIVDSSDFFDLESSEKESQDELNLFDPAPEVVIENTSNEQKENIINEIYENNESVPEEYQGMKFNTNSEEEESLEEKSLAEENQVADFGEDYDDQDDDEEDQEKTKSAKNKLHSIDIKLASGIAAAGIAVTIAVALWINNKPLTNQNLPPVNPQPINQVSSSSGETVTNTAITPDNQSGQTQGSQEPVRTREPVRSYQKPVTSNPASLPNRDLSAVLAEAFTRRTYEVDIRNISWEITADMAENPIFKNYIMVTGQALKSALARDLASAQERALNSQMEIKTVMDLNGNILEATVVQSSGSQEVDKICLATYKTTIQFTKLPKIDVNRDKIKANLIISF